MTDMRRPVRDAARPGGPGSDRRGPLHDAVRRGRRGIRQDHGPRRPGPRPGRRAARPSCARIAAITFTEKAAAELRDRLRRELEERRGRPGRPVEAGRCRVAARPARRRGHRHPALVRPAAPLGAPDRGRPAAPGRGARRGQLGRRLRPALVGVPRRAARRPGLERTLLLFFAAGVRAEALRVAGRGLRRQLGPRRRAGARTEAPEPPDGRTTSFAQPLAGVARRLARALPRSRRPLRLPPRRDRRPTSPSCAPSTTSSTSSRRSTRARPRSSPSFRVGNSGRQDSWDDVDGVRGRGAEPGRTAAAPVRDEVATPAPERLGSAIRRFTLDAAGRAPGGRPAGVPRPARPGPRRSLRDPEHGAGGAGAGCTSATSGSCSTSSRTPTRSRSSWPCASPPPTRGRTTPGTRAVDGGRGDARAALRRGRPQAVDLPLPPGRHRHVPGRGRRLRRATAGRVELTANFRTGGAGHRLGQPHLRRPHGRARRRRHAGPSQPPTWPSTPARPRRRRGPPVAVLGRPSTPTGRQADELRGAEAAEVAATVARIVDEGWAVDDGGRRLAAGPARRHHHPRARPDLAAVPRGRPRRGRHRLPGRVQLARLRHPGRARPAHGPAGGRRPDQPPPHRLRPAHAAARLRRRRPLPLQARAPGPLELPGRPARHRPGRRSRCGRASSTSGRSTTSASWLAPSELLDRIARDRRALELGFAEGRPRDVWRRLRFVIDQARAWSEATGGNLRQYLRWVAQQTAEGARVAEAVLPETDDDAVRIMTIHAAKGLEFPITIVSGMSTAPGAGRAPAEVVFPPTGTVGLPVRRRR